MIVPLFIVDVIGRIAFLSGACYLADKHPVMAGWCIFGALVCGISYTHKKNDKEVEI